jgi:hypothetical protein
METDVGREVGLGNPEEDVNDIPLSRSLIFPRFSGHKKCRDEVH